MKKTLTQEQKWVVGIVSVSILLIAASLGLFSYQKNIGETTIPITALIGVVSLLAGIALFINCVQSFLSVRASRSKPNKGFFTDNTWLDVRDNSLVLLNDYQVAVASLGAHQLKPIKQVFQNNASHKELIALLKVDQLKIAIIADITALHSRHDENLILLAEGEKGMTLKFSDIRTKAHALEKLEAKLPATLVRKRTKRSRLRSAMPRLITLAVLGASCVYLNSAAAWFFIGFLSLIFVMPALVTRLTSPTVVTTFELISEGSVSKTHQISFSVAT